MPRPFRILLVLVGALLLLGACDGGPTALLLLPVTATCTRTLVNGHVADTCTR